MARRTFGIGIFFLLLTTVCHGQISPVKQAQLRMDKGKWAQARTSLQKALTKDSLNTEAHFLLARFFFAEANPLRSVDSSYLFVNLALTDFTASSQRQKERLARTEIDSARIIRFRNSIDSTAFVEAKRVNTETAYTYFLNTYLFATQREEATTLRNEVAFLDALRVNSTESYSAYLRKYPQSLRAGEATQRFDQLVFSEMTKDGKLASYQQFLKKYPTTYLSELAIQKIFEISTASGKREDFIQFLTEYPAARQRQQALNILYFLSDRGASLPSQWLNDSLSYITKMNKGFWVPFFKNGLFGFMNEDGAEVMVPRFKSIAPNYLCSAMTDDFIVTSDGVFSRSGDLLFADSVEVAQELGLGFMKFSVNGCLKIVQKSGFRFEGTCFQDARVITSRYLAVKRNGQWGLFAINGLQLLPFQYQDIQSIDQVVVLMRTGKKILVRPDDIAAVANKQPLKEQMVFDEVKPWGAGDLQVKNGVLEGVLNQNLEFVVPFDRQSLTRTSFGFIQEKEGRMKLVGASQELQDKTYEKVRDLGSWLELTASGDRSLYHVASGRMVSHHLDSVWLQNRVLFSFTHDSLHIYGKANKLASFPKSSPVQFINSRDTSVHFYVTEKNKKTVFQATQNQKLFVADVDDLEYMGSAVFLFSRNKKKGLLSAAGKVILPAQYDVIVYSSNGYLSLYKDKKFGLFDLDSKQLIKPVYERNVVPYTKDVFAVFQNGAYGFISKDQQPLSGFEFDEVRYWNDTSALVKKNFMWSIYSLVDKRVLLDRIREYQIIAGKEGEMVIRIHRENYYGIVSNTQGVVIPPSFTDIINIGTDEKPFYFTEKRVEEADIFVVIYYNQAGKFVRKQVYESEEYERILCDEG